MMVSDFMKREYIANGLNLRVKPHKDIGIEQEEYSLCLRYKIDKRNNSIVVLTETEVKQLLKRDKLNITFKVEDNVSNWLTEDERIALGLTVYKPCEVDRGLYMKSICEILNYDYETISQKHPSVVNKNEQYFWVSYEKDRQEPYKAFYPLYENIFKPTILTILRDNYIVMPSEQDEDTGEITPEEDIDLDTVRHEIVEKLQGYSSTTEYLYRNPEVEEYTLARDLSIYIIYYTNLMDVFGRLFIEQVPFLDKGYKGLEHEHPTFLHPMFKIEGEVLKMVMANLNSSEIYILNLGNYNLLSNKDKILVEVESYIEHIENTIKNEVKILESNNLNENIVEGFINNVLVDSSKLYGTDNRIKTALPLKLTFTTLKAHNEIATEYFNNVRSLMGNKSYALNVGKISTIRFVILKTLYEWWVNYIDKSFGSMSIQLTLSALGRVETQLQAYGNLRLEYYMVTPSKMRLVIFNSYGRGEEGIALMEAAQGILYKEFNNNLDLSQETSTSNQSNVRNNLMRSFLIRVHI